MTLRHIFFAANISLIALVTQSCAEVSANERIAETQQIADIATLQQSPDKARTYDYCHWAFAQGGKDQSLPDFETMLDRKTGDLSPIEWTATAIVDAGTRIAQNSKTHKACVKIFKKGTKNFDKQYKKSLARHWAKAEYKKSEDVKIASVQETLATHWVEDQAARRVYIASRTDDKTGAEHWTRRLAATQTAKADESSTRYMTALLNEYDWIDRIRFGDRVSMAAWLMVQHADDHVELQALALKRMEPYLENEGVAKGDYAYLWDRVAVNSGKEQRYGTQPTWECTQEGALTLQPLEDPDNVNARRKKMGLDTVEVSLAEMARSVCG